MNIYTKELLISVLLCQLLVSGGHLHRNYHFQEERRAIHDLNPTKTLSSPGTKEIKGERVDGFTRPRVDSEAQNEYLSHVKFTNSNEQKHEGEGEENFDYYGEMQASGNNNDPILLDNNEITKTYERVVLDGSKIRIGCPHLFSTSITTSAHLMPPGILLATLDRNEVLKKQKQFAAVPGTFKFMLQEKKVLARRPIVLDFGHVKWFRNHVPLLNVNHFHHQTKVQTDPTTSLVVIQNASSSDDEQYNSNKAKDPVIKITELSQPATNSSSKLHQSIAVPANNQTLPESGQIRHNLSTNSIKQLQLKQQLLLETKTSENANEYVEVRKRTNMSARGLGQNNNSNNNTKIEHLLGDEQSASELYINEFGELVINKVSQYFAGKYTCLAYHRQSEVLLDVLVNSEAVGHERALKLDSGPDQANVNLKMASESTTMLNIAHEELIDNSGTYLNSDDHETGSGPIEERGQQQSAESADNKLNILDQINSVRNSTQNDDNFYGKAKSKTDETIRSIERLPNYIIRDKPLSSTERKLGTLKRDDIILKSENMEDKNERVALNLNASFDSPKKVIQDERDGQNETVPFLLSNSRSILQLLPAQIVKNEIIQLDDLKYIPGFLYSKQHLYCPIGHLHWKHIYPLMRPFCPRNPRMLSSELRCYHLAWSLISRIISESIISEQEELTNICKNSILDITWFKDGNQLEFDTNRRERNANLNIKLIDTMEQFSGGTGFIRFPRDHNEQIRLNNEEEYHSSLPKANLSSKWMCPLRGRTIEIDGVRKDSVGRYTCALRMRISKLREIIQKHYKLKHRSHSHHKSHAPQQSPLDSSYPDRDSLKTDATSRSSNNGISYCNGKDEFCVRGITTVQEGQREEKKEKAFKLEAQVGSGATNIEIMKPKRSTKSNQSPSRSDEEMDKVESQPIKTNGDHPLTRKIAIFKSILERRFSREQWLEYMEQQLSRLSDPLAVIQSFSLLVAERSANSSDLWSTITEASNAYARRKLSDFKRLKHNLERNQRPIQSNLRDANTFNDKLSSFTTTTSGFNSTEFTSASQVHDEKASKLNGSVNENYSFEIKGQQQGNKNKRIDHRNAFDKQYSTIARSQIDAIENEQTRTEKQEAPTYEWNTVLDVSGDTKTKAIIDQQEVDQMYSSLNSANDSGSNRVNQIRSPSNSYVKDKAEMSDESKDYREKNQNYESESDVGNEAGIVEPTGNHAVHSEPFNYVNERNLKPLYAYSNRHLVERTTATTRPSISIENHGTRMEEGEGIEVESGAAGSFEVLTRRKRSLISGQNQKEDYLETKELITQRGFRRANNENEPEDSNGQDSRRDNLQANNVANWHPPVIDDLEKHKMFMPRSKFLSSFSSINSNSISTNSDDGIDEKVGEEEDGGDGDGDDDDDDNDSYPVDEMKGDERSFSTNPAVAATNFISKTQKNSVVVAKILPSRSPEWHIQANIRSYDEGKTLPLVSEHGGRLDLLLEDKSQQLLTNTVTDPAIASMSHANQASDNQTNSQFSIREPNIMKNLEMEVNSIARIKTVLESNVQQQNTASGQTNTQISEPSLSATSDLNRLDESLMWSAGQYMYMHMKALASSSMFGIEVGVEWSNERSNGSNIDLNASDYPDPHKFTSTKSNTNSHYTRIKSPSPFATIDVISGQNLYLQCTAHALGRLPEVKWYKLVYSIPRRLKRFINLARRIGNDLYWPLTELNLFEERDSFADKSQTSSSSFTCSQSTSIFDNLENQTFTVISSLQLGQYNDVIESDATIKPHSIISQNYNLYACIVDADVRHNYATLGVHLREKPNKIPYEISKRLHARSVMSKSELSKQETVTNLGSPKIEGYNNYDFLRQNHFRVPLKSHWIPIHTESPIGMNNRVISDEFILTPIILSIAITIVFTSLLALIYLTMRSYRASNHISFEAVLNNRTDETIGTQDVIETDQLLNHQSHTLPCDSDLHLDSTINHRCLCHLDHDTLGHQNPSSNILQETEKSLLDSITCDLAELGQIQNDMSNNNLYQAHSHNTGPLNYMCQPASIPLLVGSPSSEKLNFPYSIYDLKSYRQLSANCCTPVSMQIASSDRASISKVNLVKNPLDLDDDR